MSEKKREVIIPEYIPPPKQGEAPHPGGKTWREITNSWEQKNQRDRVEPESDLRRASRVIREGRERIREAKNRQTKPDPVSEAIRNQASPLLGEDLENHFRKLLNLGAEVIEERIREAFGVKKK